MKWVPVFILSHFGTFIKNTFNTENPSHASARGAGRGGGTRTHTGYAQRILSPSRLPVPPRPHVMGAVYRDCRAISDTVAPFRTEGRARTFTTGSKVLCVANYTTSVGMSFAIHQPAKCEGLVPPTRFELVFPA